MKNCTLVFLKDSDKILLGMKKRGFGEGKFNGYGGKVEEDESIEEAAIREMLEESKVRLSMESLNKVAELDFRFPYVEGNKWDQMVHVFFAENWDGEPSETEEMKPMWTNFNEIPFDKMWQDDKHWLPVVLKDKHVKAMFSFGENNEDIEDMKLEDGTFFN